MDKPVMNKKGSSGNLGSSNHMMRSDELHDSKMSKGIKHEAEASDELEVVEEEN